MERANLGVMRWLKSAPVVSLIDIVMLDVLLFEVRRGFSLFWLREWLGVGLTLVGTQDGEFGLLAEGLQSHDCLRGRRAGIDS